MKKKLIAIVTSLAMVATMVPATVAAATSDIATFKTKVSDVTTAAATVGDLTLAQANNTDGVVKAAVDEYIKITSTDKQDSSWTDANGGADSLTALKPYYVKAWKLRIGALTEATPANGSIEMALNNSDTTAKDYLEAANGYFGDAEDATLAADAMYKCLTDATISDTTTKDENNKTLKENVDAAIATYKNVVAADALAKAIKSLPAANTINADNYTANGLPAALDTIGTPASTVTAYLNAALTTKLANVKTAYNNARTALTTNATNFVKAVDQLPASVRSYDRNVDRDVLEACNAYAALTPADMTVITADEEANAAYQKFQRIVTQQWNARLNVLASAEAAVKTVVMGDNDTTSIAAVETLDTYVTTFSANDNFRKILGSGAMAGGKVNGLNLSTLKTSVETELGNTPGTPGGTAATENDNAKAAAPVVIAIANLKTINDATYAAEKPKATAARTEYEALSGDQKAKVGNIKDLTAKEAAIEELEDAAGDVVTLINKIELELGGDDPKILTNKQIDAYTAARDKAQTAYNKLGTNQKVAVTNKAKLDTANNNIKHYQEGIAKENEVTSMLRNLPAGSNAADALAIAQAKKAYDALHTATPNLTADPIGNVAHLADGFDAKIDEDLASRLTRAVAVAAAALNGDETAIAAAVAPVEQLIKALPADITLADKEAVEAAEAAYAAITTVFGGAVDTDTVAALRTAKRTLDQARSQLDEAVATNTKAVTDFTNAVMAIAKEVDAGAVDVTPIAEDNTVTSKYRNTTKAARAAYNALTDAQKALVEETAKAAYDALLIAEKNVAAAATLDEVAALIQAVPNASTLDVTNAEAVQKVKDAQAAYEAMTTGAQAQLLADNYITAKQLANYENAVKKVQDAENKTAIDAVVEAIKALPQLPESITAVADAEAATTALRNAETAFNALTKEQQGAVTNASDLSKYRSDYDRLIKTYADSVYADAAKIDVEAEVSAEDIAKIRELKALVEGKYLTTANIAGFNQEVYDALMAVLDKVLQDENALENATIAAIEAVTYDGTAKTPAITVTDKAGKALTEEDYTATYVNNINAGTATVVVTAKSGSAYTGVKTAEFEITPADIKTAAKANKIADKTYTKKAIQPAVTVKAGDKTLASGADYTVSYAKNTNIGKAAVTIKGTGNYKGTITTSFIIKPAKGKVTKLTAGTKQITVSYETQKAQSGKTGYRIICKTKGIKATGTNTTAAGKTTVKKLKSGKTYQVKVRAYKTIDGTKYWGAYSAVKKVKVK